MSRNEVSSCDVNRLPRRLADLQARLMQMRAEGRLELQNGDLGFASAGSNIALLKYWGKEKERDQVPLNSSVSFSLDAFRSWTQVQVRGRFFPAEEGNGIEPPRCEIAFGKDSSFVPMNSKQELFVRRLLASWADDVALLVQTENNFPVACGLASSASGYAALVGAVADLLQLERRFSHDDLQYWLAEWARIGSGSATRSALLGEGPAFVAWERQTEKEVSGECCETRTHRLPVAERLANGLRHCVVVLDSSEKKVSSSDGHLRSLTSPLQQIRVAGIPGAFAQMYCALGVGDFATVRALSETDAFALHAVMQTSSDSVNYMSAETVSLISDFVSWRDRTETMAFWTLDAGPNVHLLFDVSAEVAVAGFLLSQRERLGRGFSVLGGTKSESMLVLGREAWGRLLSDHRNDRLVRTLRY